MWQNLKLLCVFFDFNGVLIADTEACREADNRVIELAGGKAADLNTYRNQVVIPVINYYEKRGINRKVFLRRVAELAQVFHNYYETRAAKVRSRKNASHALKWLKAHSVDSVILSNHTVSGIKRQLERLGWHKNGLFKAIIANQELDKSFKNRTKKDRLQIYLNENDIPAAYCAIIGDSPEEIEIGKALGMETIAITHGYCATWRLREQKPDHLISNLGDLPKILAPRIR